ncbi:hypothetical protein DSO57_1005429 [Entomophthora muscae]|uniref:Uncharacterized protein n=1 Tax=Entomophthora muscae TaxID=34485 RepID=A0ACC2TVT5_9FUNG|nr:hypothetical protein DSO57_1005429 [Entomophthora muscae]
MSPQASFRVSVISDNGGSRRASSGVVRKSLLPGMIDSSQLLSESGSPANTDANRSSNRMSYQTQITQITQVSTLDKFHQANMSTNKNRLPVPPSISFTVSSLLSEEEPDLSDGYQSWASKKDRTLLRMSLPIWKRKAQTSGESGESEISDPEAAGGGTLFRKPNVSMDVSDDDDDTLIKNQVEEVLEAKRQSRISGLPLMPQPIELRDGTICRKVLANLIDSYSSQPVDFMEGLFMMALDSTATRSMFVDILEEMIGSLSTLFAILDALGVQDYRAGMSANDAGIRFDLQREFTLRKDTIYSDLDDMIGVAEEFARQDSPELRQGLTIFLISIIKEYEELLLVSKCIINDYGFINSFSGKLENFDDININNGKVSNEVRHLQESIRDLLSLNSLRREQEEQIRNPEKAAEALRAYILKLEEPHTNENSRSNQIGLLPPSLSPSHSMRSLLSDCSAAKYPISIISMERELSIQTSHQSSVSIRSQASSESLRAPIAARVLMEGGFSGSPVYPVLPKGTTLDAYIILSPTSAPIPSSPSDDSQASDTEPRSRKKTLPPVPLPGAKWPKENICLSGEEDTNMLEFESSSQQSDSGVDSNGSSDQEPGQSKELPSAKLKSESDIEKEIQKALSESPQELLLPTTDYTRLRPANRFINSTQILSWAISPLGEDMGFIATDVRRADPTRSSLSTQQLSLTPTKCNDSAKCDDLTPEREYAGSETSDSSPGALNNVSRQMTRQSTLLSSRRTSRTFASTSVASMLSGPIVDSPSSSITGEACDNPPDDSSTHSSLDETELVTRFNALMDQEQSNPETDSEDWPGVSQSAMPGLDEGPTTVSSQEGDTSSVASESGAKPLPSLQPIDEALEQPGVAVGEPKESHESNLSGISEKSKDSGVAIDHEAAMESGTNQATEDELISLHSEVTQESGVTIDADNTQETETDTMDDAQINQKRISVGRLIDHDLDESLDAKSDSGDGEDDPDSDAIDAIQNMPIEIDALDMGVDGDEAKTIPQSTKAQDESVYDTESLPPTPNQPKVSRLAAPEESDIEPPPAVPASAESDVKNERKLSDAVAPIDAEFGPGGRRPSAATTVSTKRESKFKRIMVLAKLSSGGRNALTYIAPHGAEFFANQPIPPNPYYVNRPGAAQPDKQNRRVFRRGSNASSFSNQSVSDNGASRMEIA